MTNWNHKEPASNAYKPMHEKLGYTPAEMGIAAARAEARDGFEDRPYSLDNWCCDECGGEHPDYMQECPDGQGGK